MATARVAPSRSLIGGRLLAGNVLWNLAGQGLPIFVAIVAIPLLIRGLGTNRFGILSLALIAIGYFGFFDIGLGRALTQIVAQRLNTDEESGLAPLVWTTLILMLGLGLIGTIAMALLSPWLARTALRIPSRLQPESIASFYVLAATIPFVIGTAGLRGILEAHQRFNLISVVRIGMGIFTYLAPLAVLPFSKSIFIVVTVLAFGRFGAASIHLMLCFSAMPSLKTQISLQWRTLPRLLRFGGWMTVSNIVGPVLTYFDRFLVGALLSVAAVTYYATPYEIVTRLLIIPAALSGVLFPAFASTVAVGPGRLLALYQRGVKYTFIAMFPLAVIFVAFAHIGLQTWLGLGFADRSSAVLQLFAVGVFLNGLAYVPFTLIQGIGRPDLTAKLHALELAVYLPALYLMIRAYGIEGAAAAWALRTAADALVLYLLSRSLISIPSRALYQGTVVFASSLAIIGLALVPMTLALKATVIGIGLAIVFAVFWSRFLSAEERALVRLRAEGHV